MLKILELEIMLCKICKKEITEVNKPYILSCGNTLCGHCKDICTTSSATLNCPFDNTHSHINESPPVNFSFFDIVNDLRNHLTSRLNNDKKNKLQQSMIHQSLVLNLQSSNRLRNSSTLSNGVSYKGKYVNGKKHGDGEYTTKEFYFSGNFQNDLPVGPGKLMFLLKKRSFEGNFLGDFSKGKGTIVYENGDTYFGEWENFKKKGKGRMELINGNIYEGNFEDDQFEGKGAMYMKEDNKQIEGNWRKGKENGTFLIYSKKSRFPVKAIFTEGKLQTIVDLEFVEGEDPNKQFIIDSI